MILNPTQGRRFLQLLYLCGCYFAMELDMFSVIAGDTPDIEEMMEVFRQVWGPGGNRQLVDRLVEENPIGLTRSEIAIVSRWGACVYGRFLVHAEGGSVYYLAGDYAIEVRGPMKEADRIDGRPLAFVETLLLPFDGAVTYGGWIEDLSDTFGEGRLALGNTAFSEVLRAGHVVRTDRQFIEAVPRIRELMDRVGLDEVEEQVAGSDAPTHAGVLAGLSWEERDKIVARGVEDDIRELCLSIMREGLDELVLRGRPTTSMAEIMGRLRKDDLQSICDSAGLYYTKSMKKATLVDIALKSVPQESEAMWQHLVLMGPQKVKGMRDLIVAKGRIDVAADDIDGLSRLPFEAFPLVALFRSGGGFSVVVPDEVRSLMSLSQLDGLVRRAEGFDRAYRYALLTVEFRGVYPFEELVQECIDLLGVDEEPVDIAMAIAMRIDHYDTPMDIVELDGQILLVSGGLVCYEHKHELDEWETDFAYELLDRHEEVAPKPLARLVTEYGYKDWMYYLFDQSATRELVGYLDAHVPAHESDLTFAEQLIEDLCMLIAMNDPDYYDRQRVFELLEEFGLSVPDEDRALVEGLIDAFVGVAPNWYANGWPITGRRLQLV